MVGHSPPNPRKRGNPDHISMQYNTTELKSDNGLPFRGKAVSKRERETDRQRERDRERDRERQRERQRKTERETERDREREREKREIH